MKTEGAVALRHRRNWVEGERLVSEFEQSGLGRKAFCAAHGLSVHTLAAWRSRVRQSERREEIVPVEIVDDAARGRGSTPIASARRGGQFRIVLAEWLRIEVEAGFDAAELRRLIAALDGVAPRGSLPESA